MKLAHTMRSVDVKHVTPKGTPAENLVASHRARGAECVLVRADAGRDKHGGARNVAGLGHRQAPPPGLIPWRAVSFGHNRI